MIDNGFIYNMSGFFTAWQKFGDQYSYLKCPRAQIFARDYTKVGNATITIVY
jgi:hypothetical protein